MMKMIVMLEEMLDQDLDPDGNRDPELRINYKMRNEGKNREG